MRWLVDAWYRSMPGSLESYPAYSGVLPVTELLHQQSNFNWFPTVVVTTRQVRSTNQIHGRVTIVRVSLAVKQFNDLGWNFLYSMGIFCPPNVTACTTKLHPYVSLTLMPPLRALDGGQFRGTSTGDSSSSSSLVEKAFSSSRFASVAFLQHTPRQPKNINHVEIFGDHGEGTRRWYLGFELEKSSVYIPVRTCYEWVCIDKTLKNSIQYVKIF